MNTESVEDILYSTLFTCKWEQIESSSMEIGAANTNWDKVMFHAKLAVSQKVASQLEDTKDQIKTAYLYAGMVYGIHLATVLHNIGVNPEAALR